MRIAVVGAGVTGLVAAYRLGGQGHRCDVYERWPGLGGQVATLDVGDGHLLERYYHHLFTSDRHIAALYEELGMPDAIEWRPSSVAVFADGRSYPFVSPLDLLRFSPLSFPARLRMGFAALWLQRRHKRVESFESITARRWIERAMGAEPWEKVWGPLLRGKFGDRADEISMAWLWSKLTLRRRIKGGETRHEMLGYPRGSWQPLLEALRERIEGSGGRVMIDRPAVRVARDGARFLVAWGAPDSFRLGHDPRSFESAGVPERYDAVVATVPNDVFEQLLDPDLAREVGPDYLGRLHSIEYRTALCMLLELDRRFTPYYWTNIGGTNIGELELPFVGLIEQTNFVEPERYGGRRFLYIANYVTRDDPWLAMSEDELLAIFEPGLRRVNPGFSRDWVRRVWLFCEPAAQPVVTVGYQERMPPLQTPVPGLILANTTQIYPEDRGTNYSVWLGGEAAAAIERGIGV